MGGVLYLNGNDMEDVLQTLAIAKSKNWSGKPIVILMKTIMGFGVDFMMGSHTNGNGVAPNAEQTATALSQLEETL